MDQNPYQPSQVSPEPIPLQRLWVRLVADVMILFGAMGTVFLSVILYRTIETYLDTRDERHFELRSMRQERVIGIVVFTLTAPGLVLSGLAIRRMLRWRIAAITLVCVLVPVLLYLAWWWQNVRVPDY